MWHSCPADKWPWLWRKSYSVRVALPCSIAEAARGMCCTCRELGLCVVRRQRVAKRVAQVCLETLVCVPRLLQHTSSRLVPGKGPARQVTGRKVNAIGRLGVQRGRVIKTARARDQNSAGALSKQRWHVHKNSSSSASAPPKRLGGSIGGRALRSCSHRASRKRFWSSKRMPVSGVLAMTVMIWLLTRRPEQHKWLKPSPGRRCGDLHTLLALAECIGNMDGKNSAYG